MLQYIDVNKISPHQDNPRKDFGDLTELANSIKVNGILQNLTVVPWFSSITRAPADDGKMDGYYVVVIGHRRLAAAKLAGLTQVPCIVSDMSPKKQVATMLLENIQRNDLTVYEQAQGFQMMLNFGETVNGIAEQTGFSSTTVRRRVKLLELDPEKFKKSAERNVTLMDYAELEKIEDIALKNKVLDSIGTSNFKYELQRTIDSEKKEKWLAAVTEQLNTFATKVKDTPPGYRYVTTYSASRDDEEVEIPEDAGEAKYFYVGSNYGYVTLYGEPRETEEDAVEKEKKALQKARHNALGEISERAYNLRREFMRDISNSKAKKNIGPIIEYSIFSMLESRYNSLDYEDFAELLNIPEPDDEDKKWEFDDIVENLRQQPERYMLIAAYCSLDFSRENYYSWDCTHKKNAGLDRVYDFLGALGYEISDEEQAMRDGTHELFAKVKE